MKEAEVKERMLHLRRKDSKNRTICSIKLNGNFYNFYIGPDANGIIYEDEGEEYILVGNEKRVWRGQIKENQEIEVLEHKLEDFGFCILKPDCFKRGLEKPIRKFLKSQGFKVVLKKMVRIEENIIYNLYPYFFESSWEKSLIEYYKSGDSQILLLGGDNCIEKLLKIRKTIRNKFILNDNHPVINLFHAPDTREDAIREASLFFEFNEIKNHIGFLRK
ncbi:MAG: hypothetical protein PF572_06920 [Patescibacteria group bacterium]|jgi:nucleoside diphosphate kinase|nr:hypothetical protein [Patescibacteria group bacterium]